MENDKHDSNLVDKEEWAAGLLVLEGGGGCGGKEEFERTTDRNTELDHGWEGKAGDKLESYLFFF